MPNLNALIYTAADYKLLLLVPTATGTLLPFPLQTVNSYSDSAKTEDETIFAIGEVDPIGEKTNGNSYTGKIELQAGEMYAVLAATGNASPIGIKGAQLALTSFDGLVSKVYSGVNIISSDFDIKAKDKQSMVSANWKAVKLV